MPYKDTILALYEADSLVAIHNLCERGNELYPVGSVVTIRKGGGFADVEILSEFICPPDGAPKAIRTTVRSHATGKIYSVALRLIAPKEDDHGN